MRFQGQSLERSSLIQRSYTRHSRDPSTLPRSWRRAVPLRMTDEKSIGVKADLCDRKTKTVSNCNSERSRSEGERRSRRIPKVQFVTMRYQGVRPKHSVLPFSASRSVFFIYCFLTTEKEPHPSLRRPRGGGKKFQMLLELSDLVVQRDHVLHHPDIPRKLFYRLAKLNGCSSPKSLKCRAK